uniref:Uncharacterized protein n=1 Tax=Caenorhabditis japonica TaxID=281687 RepID=A0A8R1DYL1_CAEJA
MVNNRKREKTSRSSSRDQVTRLLQSAEFKTMLMTVVKEAVSEAMVDIKEDLRKSIWDRHEKMKSLEETIVAHQKRIEDMEMAIKDEKKKKEEDPAEVKERRRSIVAIGVPENGSSSMFERNLADTNKVHQLLQHVDATSAPVAVYRIGRQKEDGKPRLLKVVMSSQFAQRDLLKKAHKLKTFCGAGGRPIFLRPFMSREELVQYHDNRRKNYANKSLATNANATPLQIRKDTPTNIFTDPKN